MASKEKSTRIGIKPRAQAIKLPERSIEEQRDWFDAQRPVYERLVETAVVTLKGILDSEGIPYLSIYGRAKAKKSFIEKTSRKSYVDPRREMTDLAGIRVIVYRRSDVTRASEIIAASFGIDPERSANKSADLGVDKVGYRSVHYICRFGDTREMLPEFARFAGLVFEVQLRTALEHAWAEIEHANYKLGTKLPEDMQRRLSLAAGLLESADRELDTLALSIDEYASKVQAQIDRGELPVELNGITLTDYIAKQFPALDLGLHQTQSGATAIDLIKELRDFEVPDLHTFASLLCDVGSVEGWAEGANTVAGFVRRAMMIADVHRYFGKAWNGHWRGMTRDTFIVLSGKYGEKAMGTLLAQYDIEIMEE